MTIPVVIAGAMLFAAAVLSVLRVVRGPSMLDRTIALDVFTASMVAVIALEAAWHKRTDTLPILVVLSMVGFVGSVAIARFAAVEPDEDAKIITKPPTAQGPLALLAEQRRKKDRVRNPERYRATADESEHHGGGADGSVR